MARWDHVSDWPERPSACDTGSPWLTVLVSIAKRHLHRSRLTGRCNRACASAPATSTADRPSRTADRSGWRLGLPPRRGRMRTGNSAIDSPARDAVTMDPTVSPRYPDAYSCANSAVALRSAPRDPLVVSVSAVRMSRDIPSTVPAWPIAGVPARDGHPAPGRVADDDAAGAQPIDDVRDAGRIVLAIGIHLHHVVVVVPSSMAERRLHGSAHAAVARAVSARTR